jgi:hypothetical protein
MVEFEFNVDKARKTLGSLGKGSERVIGTIVPRSPDVIIPGGMGQSKKREEKEKAPVRSSGEIEDLKEEIRDLKARIRRLEHVYNDGR